MAFDWKGIVASVAPMIGTAVGGPFGAMAAKAGLEALGITPEAGKEEAQLKQALATATAEDLRKLKEADQKFATDMKSLDIDLARIDQTDRASARTLFAAGGKEAQIILSVVYTIGYAMVVYFFMTGQVEVLENQQILFGSLIGVLTAAQLQILNFWFGSSSGSKDKTKLINSAGA